MDAKLGIIRSVLSSFTPVYFRMVTRKRRIFLLLVNKIGNWKNPVLVVLCCACDFMPIFNISNEEMKRLTVSFECTVRNKTLSVVHCEQVH